MFTITAHRGFRLQFANGWAISVQWGPANYCDHCDTTDYHGPQRADYWRSKTAEVAVINPQGRMVRLSEFDTVEGHVSADRVAVLVHEVATGTFVEVVPPCEHEWHDDEHNIAVCLQCGVERGEPLTVGVISDKTAEASPEAIAELAAMPGVEVVKYDPADHWHTKHDGSWWEHDARGIPLARVCDICKPHKLRGYRSDVLTNPNYTADEPFEED